MNEQEKGVLISINPPYSKMIMRGYKSMEFKKKILSYLKTNIVAGKTMTVYIYETKNKGGCGFIVGQATLYCVYSPLYLEKTTFQNRENITSIVKERNETIKNLYLDWCLIKKLKPNMNEGWFSSKKFMKYIEEIGWNHTFNYALHLSDVITYNTPLDLGEFLNVKGEKLTRPPQNMMTVEKKRLSYEKD